MDGVTEKARWMCGVGRMRRVKLFSLFFYLLLVIIVMIIMEGMGVGAVK